MMDDLLKSMIECAAVTYGLNEPPEHEKRAALERKRTMGRRATATYQEKHPDLVAMRSRLAKVAKVLKAQLFEQQKGLCHICGKPLDSRAEFDHIKPLVKGGTNDADNVVLVHGRCNRKKYTK